MTALRRVSVISSAVYLATTPWHPYPGSAFLKGAAILLLAGVAMNAGQVVLGVALVLSSIGDILLDLRPEFFVAGLASFLLAHLTYIAIFVRHWPRPLRTAGVQKAFIAFFLLYGGVFAAWLVPGLGSLEIPVALYTCAIIAMVISAVLAGFATPWVAAGAILFLVSDSILAIDKFKAPVALRDYLIWITYYTAQYSILKGALPISQVRDNIKLA